MKTWILILSKVCLTYILIEDFSKEVKSEERTVGSDFGGVFPEEELEEGEIPGC